MSALLQGCGLLIDTNMDGLCLEFPVPGGWAEIIGLGDDEMVNFAPDSMAMFVTRSSRYGWPHEMW